jgi:hypothetical protein
MFVQNLGHGNSFGFWREFSRDKAGCSGDKRPGSGARPIVLVWLIDATRTLVWYPTRLTHEPILKNMTRLLSAVEYQLIPTPPPIYEEAGKKCHQRCAGPHRMADAKYAVCNSF